jgi:FixJ family two-component response regulator
VSRDEVHWRRAGAGQAAVLPGWPVAQGRTDAQIATELSVSIGTVRSHLDSIRDKTGCRRRADLTRLALSEGLV